MSWIWLNGIQFLPRVRTRRELQSFMFRGYEPWARPDTVLTPRALWRGKDPDVKQFRGGLVFEAYRLLYHSTLGVSVIKKKKSKDLPEERLEHVGRARLVTS